MKKIEQPNYFILTGAMGAGKSTVLNSLRAFKITCIDEPARQILKEQRAIQSPGVPEADPQLFTQLLLSRAIEQFQHMQTQEGMVIFDRGIADNIAYAEFFNLDTKPACNATQLYRYNPKVFFLPAWESIYHTDDERKMTFEQAQQFGESVKKCYKQFGYTILEVPLISPQDRAQWIFNQLTVESFFR